MATKPETLGVMLDVSQSTVMNVEALKRFLVLMKKMGYNMLMLYTEDTYEIPEEPYFGYFRGRYSKEELKEIDAFAAGLGIELIPCIQTLAHLSTWVRWGKVQKDMADVMLTDDERTYEVIEHMIASVAECFTSRRIHIGMDEAGGLGRGKHLDLHGQEPVSEIMKRHLGRVCEIVKKYGFSPMMWSDMFFYSWNDQQYCIPETKIPKEIVDAVPEGVDQVFWDYYHTDEAVYDGMLRNHKQFPGNVWFAGGVYTWTGFAPYNKKTLQTMLPALDACRKNHVKNIFMTMWWDCGCECSRFSPLPALLYLAEYAKGNTDEEKIKAKFRRIVGMDYDDFVQLDLPNEVTEQRLFPNPCRYMLYSDYFVGYLDALVTPSDAAKYTEYAKTLHALAKKSRKWGYLFESEARLCDILAIKYDLGVRTRALYQAGDREGIRALAQNDYAALVRLLPSFISAYEKLWMTENKPFGFEIQDFRLGGINRRTDGCRRRLLDWADGKLDRIPELEETVLPYRHYENGKAIAVGSINETFSAYNI